MTLNISIRNILAAILIIIPFASIIGTWNNDKTTITKIGDDIKIVRKVWFSENVAIIKSDKTVSVHGQFGRIDKNNILENYELYSKYGVNSSIIEDTTISGFLGYLVIPGVILSFIAMSVLIILLTELD